MDTEQPTGSDASIEQRLAAAALPEVAAEAPAEAAVEAGAPTEDAPQVEETSLEPQTEARGEPDDPNQLRALMTRKTTEAANLAAVAEDRLHFAEVREQFSEAISQKTAEVQTLRQQFKQLSEMDVSSLDHGTLWQLSRRLDTLREQIGQGERDLQGAKSHIENISKQHSDKQWGLAVQGAKQRIGTYTTGEDVAMQKLVENMGFTPTELKGRFADPRFLHMAFKAAKWDTLQSGKGKSLEAARQAPPVLKPGASKGPTVAAEQKYRDQRATLRKSGRVEDAAKLFLLKG